MFRFMFVAVAVAGLGSAARADEAEDKAVARVKEFGGTFTRDNKAPGKPVVTVDLGNTKVTDAGLKELAALKNLTTLNLYRWHKVTDAGLKELAALKNLTHARPVRHEGDGRGAEGTGRTQEPHHPRPGLHEGDGRGAEGTGRTQEPHRPQPGRHGGDGRGAKELAALKSLTTLNLERHEGDGRGAEGTPAGVAEVCDRPVTGRAVDVPPPRGESAAGEASRSAALRSRVPAPQGRRTPSRGRSATPRSRAPLRRIPDPRCGGRGSLNTFFTKGTPPQELPVVRMPVSVRQ